MQLIMYYIIVGVLLINNLLAQENLTTDIKVTNENYNEVRTLEILVNKEDQEYYKFSKTLEPHLSIPNADVFKNGNLVLIHSLEGVIEFYDPTGKLLNRLSLYSNHPYNEQSILFSIGSNSIAFLVSEDQVNTVYITNNFGDYISTFTIEDGLTTGIAYSMDEVFLACSTIKWNIEEIKKITTIFDLVNNKYSAIPFQFEEGMYDGSSNYFLGYTNNNSFLFSLIEETTLWQTETAPKEIYLDGFLENGNTLFVIAENPKLENKEWIYPNARIMLTKINGVGFEIKQIKTPIKKISINRIDDALYLNIDGNKEKIRTNNLGN